MRLLGSLPQTADQRVVAVRFNAHGDLLGVQTTSRLLQLFHVRAPEEARRKARRRAQRAREKERAKAGGAAAAATAATAAPEDASAPVAVTVADEFGALLPLRAERRVRGFSFAPAALPRERPGPKSVADHVLLSLHDNSTGAFLCSATLIAFSLTHSLSPLSPLPLAVLYQLRLSENTSDEAANALNKVAAIELPGHRSGVRALAISSDGRLLASASAENVKVRDAVRCAARVAAVAELSPADLEHVFASVHSHAAERLRPVRDDGARRSPLPGGHEGGPH
jgi:U3 small nucleolar RNA-associated protein 12